jgi:hypothetical protein
MADKTYVFKAQYDTEEAVKAIEKLSKTIIAEQANLKDLDKKLKDGKISQVDYATAVAEQTHSMNRDMQERKKYINVIQAEVGSIKRAKAENQILREERNKMVTVYGKNSKAAQELNQKIDANTKIIKGNVDTQSRWYMGIKNGIAKFALMAGAITGVVAGLVKFGKALINSSQSLSDEWTVKTEQARAATNLFLKSLASGNFDDFFGRLKDVTDQARKYAEAIDRLTDLNRSLDIQEAEVKDRLVELQIASRDLTKTYAERQKAIDEIISIETELANKKKEYTTEEKNQLLANIAMQTGISEQKIETYIREYQSIDDLLNKGGEYKAALMDLEKQQAAGSDVATRAIAATFNKKKIDEAKQALQAFGDEYKVGFGLLQMYGSLNDEEMEKLKQAYINVAQANSQLNENTRRAQTLQNTLTEQQKNDFIKAEKEKQKAVEDRIAAEGKALREIDTANAESAAFQIEIDKNIADIAIEIDAQLNETLLDNKKTLSEKLLEIEKWLTEQINNEVEKRKEKAFEYAEFTLDSAQQLTGAVSNLENAKFENEIYQIEEKKNKEIEAAENAGQSTTAIEKKYDKQIKSIKKKQAEENKKAAKFNAIISGANIVLNALKTEPFLPLGLAMSIVAGTLTGLQIAAINKEPVPFKDGTHGVLTKDVYATVAEQGQEYWRNKKLGIEGMTPKFETKAFIPEGTEIFPAYSKETKEAKERVSNDGTIMELRQIKKAILNGKREKDIVTRQGAFHIIEQNNQRTITRKRLIN